MKNLIYLFSLIFFAACGAVSNKKISTTQLDKKEIVTAPTVKKEAVATVQDSCNCLLNFNYFIEKVANNYAGFKDKVNPKTEKKYTLMVDSLRQVATNATSLKTCYGALETYRLFFYDKHLQLNANLPADANDATASSAPKQTTWTK